MGEKSIVSEFRNPGRNTLNFQKVNQLSDKEFSKLYLELMVEYRDKNDWWSSDEKTPYCSVSDCHSIITGPEDLVRYYGRSLHRKCFVKLYKKERESERNETLRKYFDLVVRMIGK
jgi:hypothetical protein